jgi:integration host factor subunit alpha
MVKIGLDGADFQGLSASTRSVSLRQTRLHQVGLTRQDCAELVERTLELTAQALERGEQVKLSGFGVFQVRSKRARMGRNPKTGEPAAIEPRRVIGFRASQVMKARIDSALSK